jgi:trans-aconitate methyltransferase
VSEAPHPGSLIIGPGLDSGTANIARIYDYLIGGKDNYAVDREAALALTAALPSAARAARDNRAFLGRAVRYLAGREGISQFLDIGTGLPVGGHVHEIAQAVNPDARVAYVDNDRVVVAHATALLANARNVTADECDVRHPRVLLSMPGVRSMIDFEQPVAVLLVAVLHFVPDTESPWVITRCIIDHLAPGSCVVISHVTGDEAPPGAIERARKIYDGAFVRGAARSRDDIEAMFDGLDLLPPGVVDVAAWRSRRPGPPRPVLFYAGIGRKPGMPG